MRDWHITFSGWIASLFFWASHQDAAMWVSSICAVAGVVIQLVRLRRDMHKDDTK